MNANATCFVLRSLGRTRNTLLTELTILLLFNNTSIDILIDLDNIHWSRDLELSYQGYPSQYKSMRIDYLLFQNESHTRDGQTCRDYAKIIEQNINLTVSLCFVKHNLVKAKVKFLNTFCELTNDEEGSLLKAADLIQTTSKYCQNHPRSQCWEGECCDLSSCQYKSSASVCRQSKSECDIPEQCTGISSLCPSDEFLQDGVSCLRDGYRGYCLKKICQTKHSVCRSIHPMMRGASKSCTNRLLKDDNSQCGSTICYKPSNLKYLSVIKESSQEFSGVLGQCIHFPTLPNGIPCVRTDKSDKVTHGMCIHGLCVNTTDVAECWCKSPEFTCSNLGNCVRESKHGNTEDGSHVFMNRCMTVLILINVSIMIVTLLMINLKIVMCDYKKYNLTLSSVGKTNDHKKIA